MGHIHTPLCCLRTRDFLQKSSIFLTKQQNVSSLLYVQDTRRVQTNIKDLQGICLELFKKHLHVT